MNEIFRNDNVIEKSRNNFKPFVEMKKTNLIIKILIQSEIGQQMTMHKRNDFRRELEKDVKPDWDSCFADRATRENSEGLKKKGSTGNYPCNAKPPDIHPSR